MLFVSLQAISQWVPSNDPLMQGGASLRLLKKNNAVFVISSGGLFKTADQGVNWTYLNNGIDSASNVYRNMAIMNNIVYVQKSRSFNFLKYASNVWTELVTTGLPTNGGGSSGMGAANGKLFTIINNNSNNYIYYSTDGTTWTQGLNMGVSYNYNNEVLNISNSKFLFTFNDTLCYTTDGISKVKCPFPAGFDASQFSKGNLTGEPNGNYIFMNGNQSSVFRLDLTASTLAWEDISANITTNPNAFLPQLAASDNVIFATVISTITDMKFMRSTDHGATFSEINTSSLGLNIPLLNNVITVSANTLISQDMSNHLFFSSDNGSTWTQRDNGLLAFPSGELVNKNGVLFNRMASDGGSSIILKSTDKGVSWTMFNNGLPEFGKPLFKESLLFLEGLFKNNYTPYVIADDMVDFNQIPYVWKLDSVNNKWVKTDAQPGTDLKRITHLGNNNNSFFVYLEQQNNPPAIVRTADAGQSWTDISSTITGFNYQQVYGLAGKGESDTLLLFGRTNNNGNEQIVYSLNNGSNWFALQTINNGQIKRINENSNISNAVCTFGGPNKTFMIVMLEWGQFGETESLYKLRNGNLERINTNGLPRNARINCIRYAGNRWNLGTTVGVYKSTDGINWSPVNNSGYYPGLSTQQIFSMGNDLVIGTNTGVWRNDLSIGIGKAPKADNGISIYPNPVNDILNIELPASYAKQPTSIEVYTLLGNKVYSEVSHSSSVKLDFSSFSEGLYLVKLSSGKNTFTTKVLK